MDELKQKLAEKTVMFWIRMVLRFMAWVVLLFMTIYRIVIPVKNTEELVFSSGDKQVFLWCGIVLLSIEIIKRIFDHIVKTRFGSDK